MMDYKSKIEKLRANDEDEFGHLNGKIFLDHAANTIYMKSVIQDYSKKLTQNLFTNPHSNSESGIYTQNFVNQTRQNVLEMFKAKEYDLVFVYNATHALKLLIELFQFDGENQTELNRSSFAYLNDNHTSVIGMRELVWSNSSSCDVYCVYEEDDELSAEIVVRSSLLKPIKNGIGNLFVYPAQSNFNGRKYPLDWMSRIQSNGDASFKKMKKTSNNWFVCLDAASLVSTSVLDLCASNKPDFVPISFYKIFGFPTGLGALLIRKSERMKNCLKKKYFGGGTVSMALVNEPVFEFRTDESGDFHDFLEDGTLSYLDIVGLNVAMNRFKNAFTNNYMSLIETYVKDLTDFALQKLNELRHYNEEKLVFIYRNSGNYGSILAFNLMDSKKKFISYILVNKLAQEFGIHLRVGCFCNIGACTMHLKILNILENFQLFGHKCGDHIDLINGEPTGACRVSFGYCSTHDEVLKLVEFLEINFIEKRKSLAINDENSLNIGGGSFTEKQYFKLVNLFIYPIKSCAPFEVLDKSWPISKLTNSLLYDRNWIIIDSNQIPLTQKRLPELVNLHANIDLKNNVMKLIYNESSHCLDLETVKKVSAENNGFQVCIKTINGIDCGDEVAKWLEEKMNLNFECRLVNLGNTACGKEKETKNKTFSNQADFLLISINSVRKLRTHLLKSFGIQINENRVLYNIDKQLMLQFRANFVVEILSGDEERHNEEFWKHIKIDEFLNFEITSLCTRCQMINISQSNIKENQEILSQLLKELNHFKANSKFGVYLKNNEMNKIQDENIAIGMIGTAFYS